MKYFKPKSVTWWSAMVPLIAGIVVALGNAFPEIDALARARIMINAISGGIPPFVLINIGLGGIGLRGAVK